MREKVVETYLRKRAKAMGGKAYKFVSPGNDGVPDRMVCLPGGVVFFVETKAPGKVSTPLQRFQQKQMRELGLDVYEDVDSREKVDAILDERK
jgi:hypothetical protein